MCNMNWDKCMLVPNVKKKFLAIIVWSFLFYSLYLYRFPSKLRSMCHCLFHVVNQRFQQSTGEAVWTVIGTVIFLRFINPAIGNVCRHLCSFLTSVYIFKLGECGIKDLNTFLLFLFSFFCQCCNSCFRVLLVVQCLFEKLKYHSVRKLQICSSVY